MTKTDEAGSLQKIENIGISQLFCYAIYIVHVARSVHDQMLKTIDMRHHGVNSNLQLDTMADTHGNESAKANTR